MKWKKIGCCNQNEIRLLSELAIKNKHREILLLESSANNKYFRMVGTVLIYHSYHTFSRIILYKHVKLIVPSTQTDYNDSDNNSIYKKNIAFKFVLGESVEES